VPDETREDLWESARASQRDDVAAALARQPWICAACGEANDPARNTCERCGGPRVVRLRRFERSRGPALVAGSVLIALAVAAALIVPGLQDDADETRRADEARLAAQVEAERRRLTEDVQPQTARLPRRARGEDVLAHRARAVAAIEQRVTSDARARVEAGRMEGPVAGTACSPFPRTETRASAELDPGLRVARYGCVAFRRRFELPELEGQARTGLLGQPFWAVADYDAGRVTWCKVTPRAGEGGKVLAFVPVPEPCRDPAGPG
jgi:hypothetical protein